MIKKGFYLLFYIVFIIQYSFSQDTSLLDKIHLELENIIDLKTLHEIDTLEKEDDMIMYHFSIGRTIRNSFGLINGKSELYQYFYDLGLRHPDDMSSVILSTFWCKRHGKEYNLTNEIDYYIKYWENVELEKEKENERYANSIKFIEKNQVSLKYLSNTVSTINIPEQTTNILLRARYLSKYNDSVYVLVRQEIKKVNRNSIYGTLPYLIDLKTNTMEKVEVSSLDTIQSSILINDTLWFYGEKNQKKVLVFLRNGIEGSVSLPINEDYPILGICSNNLILVYSKNVYKLSEFNTWILLFSSEEDMVRSGIPPQVYNDVLYLRDEGYGENNKKLWIIDLSKSIIENFSEKTGLVGSLGPRWENNFSYSISQNGLVYVSAGEGYAKKSLLCLSNLNKIAILVYNNEINQKESNSSELIPEFDISSVHVSDYYTLLVGKNGLFKLSEDILYPIVFFTDYEQKIPINNGKNVHNWGWHPSNILELDNNNDYIISGEFGGIFRLINESNSWKMITIRN